MNYYFITGTSSGIGRAIVEELLKYPNNKIFGLSRTNSIQEDSFTHQVIDLSNANEVIDFSFEDIQKASKIVLINNAGTVGEIKYLGQHSDANILDSIQVNLASAALLMNKFIAKYQTIAASKIIVNLSSGAADKAYDDWSNYCSSKAALNMYTQVIQKEQEQQSQPIKAYAIAPGVVDTLMQDVIRETEKDQFSQIDKFKKLKKNQELYKAQDVAVKMIELIENPETIPSIISRIRL